jgi:hypothetical protein
MIIIIALSVFAQGIVVINYYINKAYIAQKLCENRTRPMLNCDGKCVLAKKLAAQEKEQKDNGIFLTEKFEVISVLHDHIGAPNPFFINIQFSSPLYYPEPLQKGFKSIFIPPDCI